VTGCWGVEGAELPKAAPARHGARRRPLPPFLKGDDRVVIAWIGSAPIVGPTEGGILVDLSGMEGKRDGPARR